jgi:peptidoglycan/xylan/chitin deacetylase (PgdA/CDA1 family)
MRVPDRVGEAISRAGIPTILPRRGPLIVMYHGIGGEGGVTVEGFERQLAALTQRRRVVPLEVAVQSLGRPEASELGVITFDDGYRDFVELAVPILKERALHATVFVPAGWLGKTNGWEAQSPQRAILTGRELRELDHRSVTIGAHGFSHSRLLGMAPDQLEAEVRVARLTLEDVCGQEVTLYAYPHGQRDEFDAAAERAVATAGFMAACSTRFGRGSRPNERFRLRRVGIEAGDSLATVEHKLDGAYDWVASKEALGAFIRTAQRRWGTSWKIKSSTALRNSLR